MQSGRWCGWSLLLVVLIAAGGAALAGLGAEMRIVPEQIAELPPSHPDAVFRRESGPDPFTEFRELSRLAEELRTPAETHERVRALCAGLRGCMPEPPEFREDWTPVSLARTPGPAQVRDLWRSGQDASPLAVASLASRVAARAGLVCRVVVTDQGVPFTGVWAAGLEVWCPIQNSWIFVDPRMGLTFNTPHRRLSVMELRERLSCGELVSDTPVALPAPTSRFDSRCREYACSTRNVWLHLSGELTGEGASQPVWGLVNDGRARSWPWLVLSAGSKLRGRAQFLSPFELPSTGFLIALAILATYAGVLWMWPRWRLRWEGPRGRGCPGTPAGGALPGEPPEGASGGGGGAPASKDDGAAREAGEVGERMVTGTADSRPGRPGFWRLAGIRRLLLFFILVGLTVGWLQGQLHRPRVVSAESLDSPPGPAREIAWRPASKSLLDVVSQAEAMAPGLESFAFIAARVRNLLAARPSRAVNDRVWLLEDVPAAEQAARELLSIGWLDDLSLACLVSGLGEAAGLSCRVVATEDGGLLQPRTVGYVEVWLPRARKWALLEPRHGVACRGPSGWLSVAETRRRLSRGWSVELVSMAAGGASRSSGRLSGVHLRGFRNLWIPGSAARPGAERRDPVWTLARDADSRLLAWLPRLATISTRFGGTAATSWMPGTWTGWFVLAGLLVYGSLLLGSPVPTAGPGAEIRLAHSLSESKPEPQARGPGLRRLSEHLRGCLADLAFLLDAMLLVPRAAGRLLSTVMLALGRWWRAAEARVEASAPTSRFPRKVFLAGAVTLTVLSGLMTPRVDEDAFIAFRYARNLAEGHGLTFNPGEQGVEGFSSMLWVLLLALSHPLQPDMARAAALLGLVCTLGTLALVASIAGGRGAYAWVPIALLATNVSVARYASSGMETSLAMLLVSAAAWSWAREGEDDLPAVRRTALLCFLLAASRADGWFLFLGITAFRLLGRPRSSRDPAWVAWLAAFLVPFALYTGLRWLSFGSPVPYVYYSRLLTDRGGFEQRLYPGLLYVSAGLLSNLAWLLGLAGVAAAWRRRESARMAAVVLVMLALVVIVGGDIGHQPCWRFLLYVVPLLALLAQDFLICWQPAAGRRLPLVIALLALAGNTIYVPESSRYRQTLRLTPLAPALRTALGGEPQILLENLSNPIGSEQGRLPGFDGRVARHVARSLSTTGELVCFQAGEMAYHWPGRFVDWLGLATRPASLNVGVNQPRWLLLSTFDVARDMKALDGADYGVKRLYLGNAEPFTSEGHRYVLLARNHADTLRLSRSLLVPTENELAWYKLPPRRIVIVGGDPTTEILFDGPGGAGNEEAAQELEPLLRRHLRLGTAGAR